MGTKMVGLKTNTTRGRPALTTEEIAKKRELIAAKARELFVAEGFSAVSIRNLADAAGMSPMTLYRYFDNKADVLRYLWADVLNALFDSLEAIAKRERDATKRLAKVSIAYVDYWIEHPDHYRMVFMSEGISQPSVSVFVEGDPVAFRYRIFADCLERATEAKAESATVKAELLICALQGIAHNQITMSGYPWQSSRKLVDSLVEALTS